MVYRFLACVAQPAARQAGPAAAAAAAGGSGPDRPLEAWLKAGDRALARPAVPGSASVTATTRPDVLRAAAGTFQI